MGGRSLGQLVPAAARIERNSAVELAIAIEMAEPGNRHNTAIFGKLEKLAVDEFIDDRMREHVDPGTERHLRRLELLRVHRDAKAKRMRFVDESCQDRPEGLARLGWTAVADFDEVDTFVRDIADLGARVVDAFQLYERGIVRSPKSDFQNGKVGKKWTRREHARCFGGARDLELPTRPAERRERGHAGAAIVLERRRDGLADPAALGLVRHALGEVIIVWARVETAGVQEMCVRVDISRKDPLPGNIDDLRPFGHNVAHSARDSCDGAVAHLDDRVDARSRARSVDERPMDEDGDRLKESGRDHGSKDCASVRVRSAGGKCPSLRVGARITTKSLS